MFDALLSVSLSHLQSLEAPSPAASAVKEECSPGVIYPGPSCIIRSQLDLSPSSSRKPYAASPHHHKEPSPPESNVTRMDLLHLKREPGEKEFVKAEARLASENRRLVCETIIKSEPVITPYGEPSVDVVEDVQVDTGPLDLSSRTTKNLEPLSRSTAVDGSHAALGDASGSRKTFRRVYTCDTTLEDIIRPLLEAKSDEPTEDKIGSFMPGMKRDRLYLAHKQLEDVKPTRILQHGGKDQAACGQKDEGGCSGAKRRLIGQRTGSMDQLTNNKDQLKNDMDQLTEVQPKITDFFTLQKF